MKLDPAFVKKEIAHLLLRYPELVEDDVLRSDMIEGETEAFEIMRQLVRRIGAARAVAHGTAEYIVELKERQERMERREFSLRELIFKIMSWANLGSKGHPVELAEATLSIRNNPPSVVIVDEAQIPSEFFRVKKEPDKTRLKAALSAHETVPGAVLSNAAPSLRISIK